jgi:hypothetical protein
MKRLLALLWVSVGLMLMPGLTHGLDSANAPAIPNAQPSPAKPDVLLSPATPDQPSPVPATPDPLPSATPVNGGPHQDTVVGLPPPPFHEIWINLGTITTPNVASNCPVPCPVPLGLPVGAFSAFTPAAAQIDAKTGVDNGVAFEAGVAHGFAATHSFVFVAELPVVFNSKGDVKSGNSSLARSYSSTFFTPALRIMFGPDPIEHPNYPKVYPWISLGGGLAHFSPSSTSLAGGLSGAKSSTEGALQAAAGMDVGIYRRSIALRAEVRDFYTGPPNLGVPGINLRHNLLASAGIVFRFGSHAPEMAPDPKGSDTSLDHK